MVGARIDLTTPAGQAISYRVPNKNQCKECHGLSGEVVPIGPKARNLSHAWLSRMVADGHLDTSRRTPTSCRCGRRVKARR